MATLTSVIAVEVQGVPPSRWNPRLRKRAEIDIRPHPRLAGVVIVKIGGTRVAVNARELILAIEASTKAQNVLFHLDDVDIEGPASSNTQQQEMKV